LGGVVGGVRGGAGGDIRALAAAQSRGTAPVEPVDVQMSFDIGPAEITPSGLPEMNMAERVRAELDVLGLDASAHVLELYEPLFAALGTTRARDMMRCRSRQQILVAGVKVATQTPQVRSGTRVVFITLDDATGPVDATFFADAQIGYAATLFHSWLLVVRGTVRRTGPKGISMQADGCWDLTSIFTTWRSHGLSAVHRQLALPADGYSREAIEGAAASRSTRPVMTEPPRKLWHASPGSSGG
jgi:error-prone DNA polymerase